MSEIPRSSCGSRIFGQTASDDRAITEYGLMKVSTLDLNLIMDWETQQKEAKGVKHGAISPHRAAALGGMAGE